MSKNPHSFEEQCEQNNINQKKSKTNHNDNPDDNIPLTDSLLSNPDSFNIATHNVVTFKDPVKQNQIIQHGIINNIDIIGISETNIPHHQIKHVKKNLNNTYTCYFNAAKSKCKGNGVGLLVKSSIASHIFYSYGNHGRYIFIDLQLKNK